MTSFRHMTWYMTPPPPSTVGFGQIWLDFVGFCHKTFENKVFDKNFDFSGQSRPESVGIVG